MGISRRGFGFRGHGVGCVLAWLAFSPPASAQDWQPAASLQRPGQPLDDTFGESLSVSGKALLVGAPNEDNTLHSSGGVYVFSGEQWTDVVRLVADDEEAYSGFGSAVALDGSTAFVGTSRLEKGEVYVFGKTDKGWVITQKLREDNSDTFGFEFSLHGDLALIAAPKDSADVGKIHVYARANGQWAEKQEITASDGASGDFFALSMDSDGDNVIVGEPATNSVSPHPAAYIFNKGASGFTQQAKLDIAGKPAVQIGSAVAISGDTAVVGTAPSAGYSGNGQSIVYARSGTAWSVQQVLTVPSEESFGGVVRVQGDTVWVSAETAGQSSIYVFRRTGAVWAQTQKLSAPPAMFGPRTMAVNGGTLAVGVSRNDQLGAVQVFRNPADDGKGTSSAAADGGEASGCSMGQRPGAPHVGLVGLLGCVTLAFRRRRLVRRRG